MVKFEVGQKPNIHWRDVQLDSSGYFDLTTSASITKHNVRVAIMEIQELGSSLIKTLKTLTAHLTGKIGL